MFILAGFLVVGLICNWLVRPVDSSKYMTRAQLDATEAKKPVAAVASPGTEQHATRQAPGSLILAAWLVVWIPLAWGVWMTLQKAMLLFK